MNARLRQKQLTRRLSLFFPALFFISPGIGIHEFAHLMDKSDGAVDGAPVVGLPRNAIAP